MFHGHVFEICKLHPWPDHKVLGEAGDVGLVEALLYGAAFEVGHGGEEDGCEGVGVSFSFGEGRERMGMGGEKEKGDAV